MAESRRMPVEQDWFEKKMNDILYGYMQVLGKQLNTKERVEVELSKTEFNKELANLKKMLGVKDKRTITAAIKKFKEAGYIAEDDNKYTFPYNPNNYYVLISKELLEYLCHTSNSNVIKIYVYLKFKSNNIPNYHFTLKELKLMMGYAESNRDCEEMIRNCLFSLDKQGIISIESVYVDTPTAKGTYKTPNYILKSISTVSPRVKAEKEGGFKF